MLLVPLIFVLASGCAFFSVGATNEKKKRKTELADGAYTITNIYKSSEDLPSTLIVCFDSILAYTDFSENYYVVLPLKDVVVQQTVVNVNRSDIKKGCQVPEDYIAVELTHEYPPRLDTWFVHKSLYTGGSYGTGCNPYERINLLGCHRTSPNTITYVYIRSEKI